MLLWCKKGGLPPGNGAPPLPEEMDGLDDDDDDTRRDVETADGEAGTATPHGTAKMLQCLYSDLYGNPASTKAQLMARGESERSPAHVEADAKRVEAELLGSPPSQDFDHGRSNLDPTG